MFKNQDYLCQGDLKRKQNRFFFFKVLVLLPFKTGPSLLLNDHHFQNTFIQQTFINNLLCIEHRGFKAEYCQDMKSLLCMLESSPAACEGSTEEKVQG